MRKGTLKDRRKVVEILIRTFDSNPGVNWTFDKKVDHKRAMRRISNWAFIKALNRNGVWISSNEKGVALCYRHDIKVFSIRELLHMAWFGLTCIGFSRIRRVLKQEAFKDSVRPSDRKYYYFWFFGVLHEGKEAGFELKNWIFSTAANENLPIYVETTVERNVPVYKRYGFKEYSIWEDRKENLKVWFMKWEPSENLKYKQLQFS
jgi:hypothetical protein